MKRIHGKLLIYTGILHTIGSFIPGVFGEQLCKFAMKGFFNISKGLAEFPLLGGQLIYDNFAAFWFFYMGPILIFIGILFDYIELKVEHIPYKIILSFSFLTFIGAYMIPLSGMTILLIPQCLFMLIRTRKYSKSKNTERYL